MLETSNIGQTGLESMRIGGMRVDDLPMAAAAAVKAQLPLAIDTDRQAKVEGCIAKYPKAPDGYFDGRIREAESNIAQQGTFKADIARQIAEYRGLRAGGEYRDVELAKLDADGTIQALMAQRGAERIRAQNDDREPDYTDLYISGEDEAAGIQCRSLKVQFPAYNELKLQQQINQFDEAIQKADAVIAAEYVTIAELTGLIALVKVRDAELKSLGVSVAGITKLAVAENASTD